MVDSTIREDNKMGEMVASNPSLQVSVSFGRFESESLSWEKWSTFSPNKYLEEVEKCATPGSVAQKKAYFEAHYKKIAARKAELLDQEKQMEMDSLRSQDQNKQDQNKEDQNKEDVSDKICRIDAEFDASNGQDSLIKEIKQVINSSDEVNEIHVDGVAENVAESRDCQSKSTEEEKKELDITKEIKQVINSSDKVNELHVDGVAGNVQESRDCQSISTEEEKKEVDSRSDGSQLVTEEPEEAVYIKEEPVNVKEVSCIVDNEIAKEQTSKVEAKHVKLDHPKESKKVNHVNRESSGTKTKRKPVVVPTSKAHQISTPRSSRPTPTKTLPSASSSKKANSPSLSGRKNPTTMENKRVANKSIHMSLSLGPSNTNSDPVPVTLMRKSLIMEKMGDKDIVKRAFKTFQNNFNQSKTSAEVRTLVKGQAPSNGKESKVETSMSSRKENGRPRTVDSLDKRNGNVVRSSVGLKSDIRAVKGKEPSKKMVGKPNVKEVERSRLQSKPKEEKEAETKRSKQNVKTTTLPTFYRGQKVSERHQQKGGIKPENPR